MKFKAFGRFLSGLIKPLPDERRLAIIDEITPAASPGFDFFLLVILSCSIATLGLITNSPAVIIGAMLLAPLMSPLIGIGLASITGNPRLLSSAASALLRGALVAILLAFLVTLVNTILPFVSFQELPNEIVSRTRPSPIDLIIALSGGLAAAYAMTQPNLSAALPGVAIATALMPPCVRPVLGSPWAAGMWPEGQSCCSSPMQSRSPLPRAWFFSYADLPLRHQENSIAFRAAC
jgi:uncharacterized hydrophobic protein (TIGR00271 family)